MSRVLIPFTLVLALGCSSSSTRPGEVEDPECVCAAHHPEGCDCAHCSNAETGQETVKCPCGRHR